jgi:hypothetical protein
MRVRHKGELQRGLHVKVLLQNGSKKSAVVRWTHQKFAELFLLDHLNVEEEENLRRMVQLPKVQRLRRIVLGGGVRRTGLHRQTAPSPLAGAMPRKSRTLPPSPFRRFNSSPEVIRLVVLMYVRFPLSLRHVEDLLFERGIDICHETVRFWWNRFGPCLLRTSAGSGSAGCAASAIGDGTLTKST